MNNWKKTRLFMRYHDSVRTSCYLNCGSCCYFDSYCAFVAVVVVACSYCYCFSYRCYNVIIAVA